MQHFLLFTIVLTAITFISLFWASSHSNEEETTLHSGPSHPHKVSIQKEAAVSRSTRDIDEQPGSSRSPLSGNNYAVLGVN